MSAEPIDHEIRAWQRRAGAVALNDPPSRDGLARLHAALDPWRSQQGPDVTPTAPCWRFVEGDDSVRLEPCPDPGRVCGALFPRAERSVQFGTMLAWHRRGARRFWFHAPDGWSRRRAKTVLLVRVARGVRRRLLRTLGLEREPAVAATDAAGVVDDEAMAAEAGRREAARRHWGTWIEHDAPAANATLDIPTDRPLRVVLYIGSLSSGGAERQLCNLALELARRDVEVHVVTTYEAVGTAGHYTELLRAEGLDVHVAGARWVPPRDVEARSLIDDVPADIWGQVVDLSADLAAIEPDVLHCWLDHPNITGGAAGLIAGVPRVLLSTRNSNPTNFPRLNSPYLEPWYKLLAESPRVRLLANSHSGAESYAEWIGIPSERIHVVLNGLRFDHFPDPSDEARATARATLELAPETPVVVGAFRLDDEKRPHVFLDVVADLVRRRPDVRVMLAGTGPLEDEVRARVRTLGLDDNLTMLGRRRDIGTVLLAADAMLLTSTLEGCPNVVLEAGALGVPVVATAGGGTVDVIVDGRTGYLAEHDDVIGMAERLARLLDDSALRDRLGQDAQRFVRECFRVEGMTDLTMKVYEHMLTQDCDEPPVVTPRPDWLDENPTGDDPRPVEAAVQAPGQEDAS